MRKFVELCSELEMTGRNAVGSYMICIVLSARVFCWSKVQTTSTTGALRFRTSLKWKCSLTIGYDCRLSLFIQSLKEMSAKAFVDESIL